MQKGCWTIKAFVQVLITFFFALVTYSVILSANMVALVCVIDFENEQRSVALDQFRPVSSQKNLNRMKNKWKNWSLSVKYPEKMNLSNVQSVFGRRNKVFDEEWRTRTIDRRWEQINTNKNNSSDKVGSRKKQPVFDIKSFAKAIERASEWVRETIFSLIMHVVRAYINFKMYNSDSIDWVNYVTHSHSSLLLGWCVRYIRSRLLSLYINRTLDFTLVLCYDFFSAPFCCIPSFFAHFIRCFFRSESVRVGVVAAVSMPIFIFPFFS